MRCLLRNTDVVLKINNIILLLSNSIHFNKTDPYHTKLENIVQGNLSLLADNNFVKGLIEKLIRIKHTASPGTEIVQCIILKYIWLIVPLIILFFGTFGNVLAFLVLSKRSRGHISYYTYFSILTVVDQLILMMGLLRKWLFQLGIERMDNKNKILCSTLQTINSTLSWISTWLLMLLTVYRAFVICFPFSKMKDSFRKKGKIIIIMLILFAFCGNYHFFFTVDIILKKKDNRSERGTCKFKSEYSSFVEIWSWIDATIYSYIPFIIITIANFFIIKNLFRSRNIFHRRITKRSVTISSEIHFNHQSIPGQRFNESNGRLIQISTMLLAVSCCFIVTTSPIVIMKGITSFININSALDIASYELLETLAELLMYFNHGSNFYLYLLSGSNFRQNIKILFKM